MRNCHFVMTPPVVAATGTSAFVDRRFTNAHGLYGSGWHPTPAKVNPGLMTMPDGGVRSGPRRTEAGALAAGPKTSAATTIAGSRRRGPHTSATVRRASSGDNWTAGQVYDPPAVTPLCRVSP